MTAEVIKLPVKSNSRNDPLRVQREEWGEKSLHRMISLQQERKKLSCADSIVLAKGCSEIIDHLAPKPRDLRRAAEALQIPFETRYTGKLLLRAHDPLAKQQGEGLHRTPIRYVWFIRAVAKATGESETELAAFASRHASFHPLREQHQTELNEAAQELSQICQEMDERFSLLEAYRAISEDNLNQFHLGRRDELWPAQLWMDEALLEFEWQRAADAQRRERASRLWFNLWLGDSEPTSDRRMQFFASPESILSMPRAYLGVLVEPRIVRDAEESELSQEPIGEPTPGNSLRQLRKWSMPHSWLALYPDIRGRRIEPALIILGEEWGNALLLLDKHTLSEVDCAYVPWIRPRRRFLNHLVRGLEAIRRGLEKTIQDDFLQLPPLQDQLKLSSERAERRKRREVWLKALSRETGEEP